MRSLLDARLLVILVTFSILFCYLFLMITQDNWNYSASFWDVDFYRELVAEFGTELSLDEWDGFLAKRQQLVDQLMVEVRKSTILENYGIDSYEKFLEAWEDCFFDAKNLSSEEEEVRRELNRIIFDDKITTPICFQLQCMDHVCSSRENGFIFADGESADKWIAERFADEQNVEYQQLCKRNMTADSVSLLHPAVTETVDDDFLAMLLLAAIWCFALILPYQIGERLRGIRDIQLCTKTGRNCFRKQAGVSVVIGLLVGGILCVVYAILLARKGAFDFAACKVSCRIEGLYHWFDMTYTQYLVVYALFILLGSIASALLAYFVGRCAASYIAGVGIAIPTVAALCIGMNFLGCSPFRDEWALWSILRACGVPLVCAVCASIVCILLKRDKARDIV